MQIKKQVFSATLFLTMFSKLVFVSSLVAGVAANGLANPTIFDDGFLNQAEGALRDDCGDKCVSAFRKMMKWASDNVQPGPHSDSVAMKDALSELMKDAENTGKDLVAKLTAPIVADVPLTSFIRSKAKMSFPVDVPCVDDVSCAVLEKVAERCNFGRVGAQATYQAVNLAVHVVTVVTSLMCGCLYVGNMAACVLGKAPWCTFMDAVFTGAYKNSVQAWEAVKGATKTCSIHGDPRIASR
jgi:hypothetical protein